MRLATLYYSPEADRAKISVNDAFEGLDPLMRLDALKDCLAILEDEYKKTLHKWGKQYGKKQ